MRTKLPGPHHTPTRLRWLDADPFCEPNSEVDLELGSISSEEGVVTEGEIIGSVERSHNEKSRPRQDVWEREEVVQALRAMPAAEELEAALDAGNIAAVEQHPQACKTGLLWAAWRADAALLTALLGAGASTYTVDTDGRTPLHLACCAGSVECINILLRNQASVQVWDAHRNATPLHCAASVGNISCVRRLLDAGADVNAGLSAGRSPIHYAVKSDAPDCVEVLLRAGACPNTPQVFTETPLHVAAAMGFAKCAQLLLEHGADVRVQFGAGKITALHLAAEDGNAECARLLLDAGAQINVTNQRLQTPLHLAALAQSAETLELLLKRGADKDVEDADGRTPLHSAIVKVCHSCECVRLLLDAGATVNKADAFGYTPLHIAALNEFSNCVFLLLRYGADATARTNGGVSALSFIVRRTPDILPRFQAQLDSAVRLHEHEIGDVDCELQLDFRILVPNVERGESGLLLAFIEVGQRHILKHPLCQTFLFLKWKRIRKFFLLSLLFHAVFVLVYSAYVAGIFLKDCNSTTSCEVTVPVKASGYFLLTLTSILSAKELFQMAHSWSGYVRHWENWLQLSIIACACATCIPSIVSNSQVQTWQHHVAAVGIFLTWLELMMLVGRFPMFGLYVQMFTTVAVNFAKFLLAYCCLLVAFSLSFGVLFPNYKAFKHVAWSLMKTVVMMSGELEFEDIFYIEKVKYPITAHLVFLAFVLLVTVILTNLLVGLAVSDIQGLQQSAGLDRLVRQAELVAHLESMLFSRLLHCLPAKLLALCHHSALLLTSPYHWVLHVRPNDPREHRAPRDLVDASYRLVAGRKERSRRNARRSTPFEDDYMHLNSLQGKRPTIMDDDYTASYTRGKRSTAMEEDYTSLNYAQSKRTTAIEDDYPPLTYVRIRSRTMDDDYISQKRSNNIEDDFTSLSYRESQIMARNHIGSVHDEKNSRRRKMEHTLNQIISQLSVLASDVKKLDSSTKQSLNQLTAQINNLKQT